ANSTPSTLRNRTRTRGGRAVSQSLRRAVFIGLLLVRVRGLPGTSGRRDPGGAGRPLPPYARAAPRVQQAGGFPDPAPRAARGRARAKDRWPSRDVRDGHRPEKNGEESEGTGSKWN